MKLCVGNSMCATCNCRKDDDSLKRSRLSCEFFNILTYLQCLCIKYLGENIVADDTVAVVFVTLLQRRSHKHSKWHQSTIICSRIITRQRLSLLSRGSHRISQNQNHRITPEEHLGDVSVLINRLCLFPFPRLGCFSPHFFNVLENHVTMPIERFHPGK